MLTYALYQQLHLSINLLVCDNTNQLTVQQPIHIAYLSNLVNAKVHSGYYLTQQFVHVVLRKQSDPLED